MDQRIIDYLNQYKDKYEMSLLKEELRRRGYSEEDIDRAEKIAVPSHEELPIFPSPFDTKYQQPLPKKPEITAPELMSPEPPRQDKNKKAKTAMILGIIALLIGFIPIIGWVISILAIIFGIIGLIRSNSKEYYGGKGASITGIILGAVGLILAVYFMIKVVIPMFMIGSMMMVALDDMNITIEEIDQEKASADEAICIKKCESKGEEYSGYAIFGDTMSCLCSKEEVTNEYIIDINAAL